MWQAVLVMVTNSVNSWASSWRRQSERDSCGGFVSCKMDNESRSPQSGYSKIIHLNSNQDYFHNFVILWLWLTWLVVWHIVVFHCPVMVESIINWTPHFACLSLKRGKASNLSFVICNLTKLLTFLALVSCTRCQWTARTLTQTTFTGTLFPDRQSHNW